MKPITRLADGAVHGAFAGAVRPAAPGAPYPPALPGGYGGHPARPAWRAPGTHGAEHGAFDAALVIHRLEEAGMTLLALPGTGHTTKLRTSALEIVRPVVEAYGWEGARLRPAVPSAARITRMDEALAWVLLIPRQKVVIRRIVGARSLVSPITERHLFSWRRLGATVGADHKAVQRWHAQGVEMIVAGLGGADARLG
ncbi:MAG TPA: DUF6362 family protein [Acetobacteraceae bacterium]|nr:DUF6362 family protein [Acetobacteraceae bacterium]